MANSRDKGKKMIGFWATEAEKKALQAEAKRRGYSNLAEFLRAIASGSIKVILLAALASWFLMGDPLPGAWLVVQAIGTAAYYAGIVALEVVAAIV
jgi:hypothetical protein